MPSAHCPSCHSSRCVSVGPIPDNCRFAGAVLPEALPGGVLYRCETCALWFRFPRLPKEIVARLYENGASEVWSAHGAQRKDWALVEDCLNAFVPSGRVLDVGCFDGALLARLSSAYLPYGVELNGHAAERARQRGVTVLRHDFDDLPHCKERFHAIIATDVVEHTSDPLRFLRDCAKLLLPGGVVIITTGTTDAWSWRVMGGRYWYCANPEHLSFLNKAWVQNASAQLSLQTVRVVRFAHDASLRLSAMQMLLNLSYWAFPRMFAAAKRVFARDPSTRKRPDMGMLPPSWSTARDHVLVALRASG